MEIHNFGSICSGIEAASYVLEPKDIHPLWLSENAEFASKFLSYKYPNHHNIGDMCTIPELITNNEIETPDLLVGGTPCQAFSLAGWRNGTEDERGQLTLRYIDIINAIDNKKKEKNLPPSIFFWENVEGALTDKTNAFGCFLAGLAGLENPVEVPKFKHAGVLYGPQRNIAWRVLDAKYFGLPQQRKRVYVMGGSKDFHPENVLFEIGERFQDPFGNIGLFDEPLDPDTLNIINERTRNINGQEIEVFRHYSDCLYAAYGTKWNGNAAALNGSLFVCQNGRLRRLTPKECERLMGFEDDYTLIPGCRLTNRFHATGNSWAVPVINWIMDRLLAENNNTSVIKNLLDGRSFVQFDEDTVLNNGQHLNCSEQCYNYSIKNMLDIVDTEPDEKLYISKAGCAGILRRKEEKNQKINARLEIVLRNCSK